MTNILGRDLILAVSDIVVELVDVPEWGGSVYVKGMTGKERDAFESSLMVQRGNKQVANLQNIRAKLAAQSICDESGKLLFSQADIEALSAKNAGALQKIFTTAQRLSGITDKAVEELAEKLETNFTDDSASVSPSPSVEL